MRHLHFAALAALIASPVSAEPSIDDQQAAVDLAKAKTEQLDAELKLIRESAAAATSASTAEGLEGAAESDVITRALYDAMAGKIAAKVGNAAAGNGQIIIIFDNQPPSVAAWLAFDKLEPIIRQRLSTAVEAWDSAQPPAQLQTRPRPRSPVHIMTFSSRAPAALQADEQDDVAEALLQAAPLAGSALGPAGAAVGVALTVASLARTDFTVKGALLKPTDRMLDAALRVRLGIASDVSGFTIAAGIDESADTPGGRLNELGVIYEGALRKYRVDYLSWLATKAPEGKPAGAPGEAGRLLAAAIADYDLFIAGLYTPIDGQLPLTAVERQRKLIAAREDKPILYIRDHGAALTTITRKGLLHSFGGPPTTLTVAASADYMLVKGDAWLAGGGVTCLLPQVKIAATAATVKASFKGGIATAPADCTDRPAPH